jgi:7-cyano-7-deazaguanine synthase in queuosine biosynthesis
MVIKYCRQLDLDDVHTIYMAFDYNAIKPVQAETYAQKLARELGVEAEIVNEPVKMSSLLLKAADQ